jgi:hypothetical protein
LSEDRLNFTGLPDRSRQDKNTTAASKARTTRKYIRLDKRIILNRIIPAPHFRQIRILSPNILFTENVFHDLRMIL